MKAMLGIVAVLAGFALIYALAPDAVIKNAEEVTQKCMTTAKVSFAQINQLIMMNGTVDRESYCWLACTAKGIGIMTSDNKFNKEKITEFLNIFKNSLPFADKFVSISDKCQAEVTGGSDECTVAKNAYDCVTKYATKEGIINKM